MADMLDFKEWAHQKWELNCEEHEAFGENWAHFPDYVKDNEDMLRHEYITEMNEDAK